VGLIVVKKEDASQNKMLKKTWS